MLWTVINRRCLKDVQRHSITNGGIFWREYVFKFYAIRVIEVQTGLLLFVAWQVCNDWMQNHELIDSSWGMMCGINFSLFSTSQIPFLAKSLYFHNLPLRV
jgi:hypothetical protein